MYTILSKYIIQLSIYLYSIPKYKNKIRVKLVISMKQNEFLKISLNQMESDTQQ